MPLEMDDADDDDPPAKGGPRFGGKRFGAQRKQGWRRSGTLGRSLFALGILAGIAALATAGYALKTFLGSDSRFRITGTGNIVAAGLAEVSRAELNPVFGEDIGRNIFFVPLGDRRKQLEEIPWVERATVMRVLPDQIHVQIVERKPVAFVLQDGRTGLVDANGVLLSMPAAMMAQHHYSFPVLTGIDAHQSPGARKARMELYLHLLAELDSDGQRISDQISQIDLSDQEDARVTMPQAGGDILAHFGEDHFMERYQRYKTRINGWRQQYPKLASVDLRYEQQVVLDMSDGATAANVLEAPPAANENPPSPGSKVEVKTVLSAAPKAGKESLAKAVPQKDSKPARANSAKAGLKPGTKAAKAKPVHKTARQKAEEKARDKKRAAAKRANLSAERHRSAARTAALTASGQ
jgi:cell division protein FtsQ